MSKIIKFYQKDAAKNPDVVLEQAIGKYNSVFIIGWDKEDILDVRATLDLNAKELMWLIELFKHKLLSGDYGFEA